MAARVIFIGGPTGVGKTDLAERIANETNGEIISLDSRAIYRGMDIGTGKAFNSSDIDYHMIDLVDPGKRVTTYHLVSMTRKKIEDILSRERTVVLCGGSHFWMERTIKGFDPGPEPDQKKRKRLKDLEMLNGNGFLHKLLEKQNPQLSAKVNPNNVERIIRYIELSENNDISNGIAPFSLDYAGLFLVRSMDDLNRRIMYRTRFFLENGWLRETEVLLEKGMEITMPGMDSIGYSSTIEFINGNICCERMHKRIYQETQRMAKEQMKWFKRLPHFSLVELDRGNDKGLSGILRKYLTCRGNRSDS